MRDAHPDLPVEALNGDCHAGLLDRAALQREMRAQGDAWHALVAERCPHLFADVAVFISSAQLRQMREVIEAVERVVWNREWLVGSGQWELHAARGVFYGYDFHLSAGGAHLIEINTNAGGGFLNVLLLASQRDTDLPGKAVGVENPEQEFPDMFLNEWRLERGDTPLRTIAIIDEQPEEQYLYPEFLLAKNIFERAGIAAYIVDPAALQARDDGLYLGLEKIDLVYNRLTDFDLKKYPPLRSAHEKRQAVLTPNPENYHRYADKRKLALFSDGAWLRTADLPQAGIDALLQGIPETRIVRAEDADEWWANRKQWFFKPVSGYGGKGAYRGEKLTRRVFEEIMQADYVAQRLALPGERKVCIEGAEPQSLKYDVRCYVYDGQIQLVAARLYQGQTTNFRTPGGGFALVRLLG